jgi:hypothetical protein
LPCLFQFSFVTILSSFHFQHKLPPLDAAAAA